MFFSRVICRWPADVISGLDSNDMYAESLFRDSDLQNEKIVEYIEDQQTSDKKPSQICCAACGHEITETINAIEVNQQHLYTFTNQAGLQYTIRCFSEAKGCTVLGIPTSEHTWFDAYKWQVICCQACQIHLGWLFSGEGNFYGLIKDRLIEPGA